MAPETEKIDFTPTHVLWGRLSQHHAHAGRSELSDPRERASASNLLPYHIAARASRTPNTDASKKKTRPYGLTNSLTTRDERAVVGFVTDRRGRH